MKLEDKIKEIIHSAPSTDKAVYDILEYLKPKSIDIDWMDEWIELFPEGIRTGGKLVRSDKKSCLSKMKTFIKDYPYDKEIILGATSEYIREKQNSDSPIRCAVYFIEKRGEGSDLAAECARFVNQKSKYAEVDWQNDFI